MRHKSVLFLIVALFVTFFETQALYAEQANKVLLAILARNKAHVLPYFLKCIENLDYDKKLITVYINTNNNVDKTEETLKDWVEKNKRLYSFIDFEKHNQERLKSDNPHEWTPVRFKVLGEIRNKSLAKTKEYKCDYYFVIDCDNFINPCTLKDLINNDKPIIAPMLTSIPEANDPYSNYHYAITPNGYYKNDPNYYKVLARSMKGAFKVPVVHCTYLIKSEYIDKLTYVDGSDDYEYVIFSRSARNHGVDQYICNDKDYGCLVHFKTDVSLNEEKCRIAKWLQFKNNNRD